LENRKTYNDSVISSHGSNALFDFIVQEANDIKKCRFENCFDKIMAIWTPDDLRKKRLLGRNFSPDEVDRRDRMQIPVNEKLERADFGIINSGSLDELYIQLEAVADKLEQIQK
jgi:dephospho-CoA kinase